MFDLKNYIQTKNKLIDKTLDEIFQFKTNPGQLAEAMRYSLTAGGKRIRPVLCIAANEAVGGDGSAVLKVAGALEMIHTYSLIHDDLPAMDDDKLRRGKPTCHIRFDEATAILAGDALLTLAFEVIAAYGLKNTNFNSLEIIRLISQAIGARGMIEGQMQDIAAEGNLLNQAQLEKMHSLKTGALIEAAVYSGALTGNAGKTQINALKTYSRKIGLAFQVTDDILNVKGDPIIMGKAAGTDLKRNKSTYPAILGLEKSVKMAKNLIKEALAALTIFDERCDPLREVAVYIIKRQR